MKKYVLIFLVPALLWGCKGGEKAASVSKNAPEWVTQKPVSSSYYIGIGSASKNLNPDNYIQAAKQNALNDLASEIKVTIKSNSILYSLERRGSFDEDYLSTTKLNSTLNLSGFELVDNYTDDDNYYVYYRLSKSEYAAQEARKRDEAANKAANYIGMARKNKQEGAYKSALNNYLQALLAVNEYLGEALQVNTGSGSEYISTTLIAELTDLFEQISFTIPEDALVFDFLNREEPAGLYVVNKKGKALSGVPFKIKKEGAFARPVITSSNSTGFIQLSAADLEITRTSGNLSFNLQKEEMLSEAMKKEKLVEVFLENFPDVQKVVPFKVAYPSLFFVSKEKNQGELMGMKYLQNALTQGATENGFPVTTAANRAEVVVEIDTDTQNGGVAYDLYTSILNGKITFLDQDTKEPLYVYPIQNMKGAGLNYETAGVKAYERASEKLKQDVLQNFLKSYE